jgi:hypothetical protein
MSSPSWAMASRPPNPVTRGVHIRLGLTVPAFPLTRILVVTDAWLPQVNGVVRAIEALVREAPALGVEIEILAADGFRTVPLPTYPQLRVAVTRPNAVRRRIEELKPDFIHIATEGPLGLCAWFACRGIVTLAKNSSFWAEFAPTSRPLTA